MFILFIGFSATLSWKFPAFLTIGTVTPVDIRVLVQPMRLFDNLSPKHVHEALEPTPYLVLGAQSPVSAGYHHDLLGINTIVEPLESLPTHPSAVCRRATTWTHSQSWMFLGRRLGLLGKAFFRDLLIRLLILRFSLRIVPSGPGCFELFETLAGAIPALIVPYNLFRAIVAIHSIEL